MARGKTLRTSIKSTFLNEDRTVSVYTPAGYDGSTASNLLIVFDGGAYGALSDPGGVPTQTILDNLIAEKRVRPTVAVLVWSMGKRNRDLAGMAGDLVSNMYEEIVYRGLMFCAFYGVASASSFPLAGKLNLAGLVVSTIGSCAVFAAGHDQYSLALRAVVGVVAVVFAYPWISARSLWAPWIPHTLGDVIADSILKL